MKFWYFSFGTLCFASSFILPYPTGAPLTLREALGVAPSETLRVPRSAKSLRFALTQLL